MMLKEQEHDEQTKAFANELVELLQKYNDVEAICLTAMLSQFAGQTGAHAAFYEGYSTQQISSTVGQNSAQCFMKTIDALEANPTGMVN